jgi:primosomal protein N' (replication factor Y)
MGDPKKTAPVLVDCVVPIGIPGPLTYIWPFDYIVPEKGLRLLLPLGSRKITGILWDKTDSFSEPEKLKAVSRIMDQEPVMPEFLLNFIEWASNYYLYPIGLAVSDALPVGFLGATKKSVERISQKENSASQI